MQARYKGVLAGLVVICLALSALAWRQAQELRAAQARIMGQHYGRIGDIVSALNQTDEYLKQALVHDLRQEERERDRSLLWAVINLRRAESNLNELYFGRVIDLEPWPRHVLTVALEDHIAPVEQMLFTSDLTGITEVRKANWEMFGHLHDAWREANQQPDLLMERFAEQVRTYRP